MISITYKKTENGLIVKVEAYAPMHAEDEEVTLLTDITREHIS